MKTAARYRINRKGDVVHDTRAMTSGYLSPAEHGYKTGDYLYVPKSSSPAREAHPSRNKPLPRPQREDDQAARNRAALAAVAKAART